ncbi:MAG: hypothetical protein GX846_01385 [Deltaproteobacteria bacterium]|nr:hypothetical protein [Deltaproteobacteria bacterium]
MKFDTVITEDFEPPGIHVMPVSDETTALLSKSRVTTLRRIYSSPKFKTGQKTTAFRKKFFSEASSVEWNNWQWQLRNRIRDLDSLKQIINLSDD